MRIHKTRGTAAIPESHPTAHHTADPHHPRATTSLSALILHEPCCKARLRTAFAIHGDNIGSQPSWYKYTRSDAISIAHPWLSCRSMMHRMRNTQALALAGTLPRMDSLPGHFCRRRSRTLVPAHRPEQPQEYIRSGPSPAMGWYQSAANQHPPRELLQRYQLLNSWPRVLARVLRLWVRSVANIRRLERKLPTRASCASQLT